jgi:ParB family chromosome partitioning protein
MARKALGRGISAIIPDVSSILDHHKSPLMEIELDRITANPSQPREEFDQKALDELAKSIGDKGLLQPVVVRAVENDFQLIIGERRARAARLAGLKKIPAIVLDVTQEREMLELALIENLQREDLNPIDQARAYQKLIEQCELTQEEVSQQVKKDRASISNTMRLLKLPVQIQDMVRSGTLTAGHARALLALDREQDQVALARRIARGDLSVRAVERMVAQRGPRKVGVGKRRRSVRSEIREIAERLQRRLGTAVRIVPKGKGGRLEIDFYSDEDLERLINLIQGSEEGRDPTQGRNQRGSFSM